MYSRETEQPWKYVFIAALVSALAQLWLNGALIGAFGVSSPLHAGTPLPQIAAYILVVWGSTDFLIALHLALGVFLALVLLPGGAPRSFGYGSITRAVLAMTALSVGLLALGNAALAALIHLGTVAQIIAVAILGAALDSPTTAVPALVGGLVCVWIAKRVAWNTLPASGTKPSRRPIYLGAALFWILVTLLGGIASGILKTNPKPTLIEALFGLGLVGAMALTPVGVGAFVARGGKTAIPQYGLVQKPPRRYSVVLRDTMITATLATLPGLALIVRPEWAQPLLGASSSATIAIALALNWVVVAALMAFGGAIYLWIARD